MKRVLVVFYGIDGWEMGPIRLRRIVRNLSRHGFTPVVLTSSATGKFTESIPEGVEVIRVKSVDLGDVYKKFRTGESGKTTLNRSIGLTSEINRWLMVPDKQIVWKRPAIKTALNYLRQNPVDLIFGSLGCRTNLLVAAKLSRALNVPCVLEFRDLWTGSPYYHLDQPTALHRWIHARLERGVIDAAGRVTVVCRGLADYLQARYKKQLKQPIAIHYNFYDPAEFSDLPARQVRPDAPMIVSYVGAMYATRNPFVFFEGMKLFIDRFQIKPHQFRFRWVGSVLGVPQVEEMISRLNLAPYIDHEGQRSHRDALKILRESDFSLIIQAPGDDVHIPGKLFEAMGAEVPVMALSEPCEVASIIQRTHSGVVCPHDSGAVCETLHRLLAHVATGAKWKYNEQERLRFHVDAAVSGLADLFRETLK